jgi:hypothetical protein
MGQGAGEGLRQFAELAGALDQLEGVAGRAMPQRFCNFAAIFTHTTHLPACTHRCCRPPAGAHRNRQQQHGQPCSHDPQPLAWEKRSRTREAPTPTNISTNSEALSAMKVAPASPATALQAAGF